MQDGTKNVKEDTRQSRQLDTGLVSLVAVAKALGVPADLEQMCRAYVVGKGGMDEVGLLRAANDLSLKARVIQPNRQIIGKIPFPAIAQMTNGNYFVILKMDMEQQKALVLDPQQSQPLVIPLENIWKAWNGKLILLARRLKIKDEIKKFGLTWFIPVIARYKKFFSQVLFLSLVLQVFGLISPLFTQVIIDKVLVHRSLNTLDVFVGAMCVVAVFQVWITALRSYLFTHTTNKIDVVLSSQLFRHIAALPLRFFETWQVGDVVSRVRELENVRQFITGSALTVVLDVVFAVVCIGMMFTYNITLSVIALLALPVYVILNLIVTPIFRRRINRRFVAATENQSFLIESVTGVQTIKTMAVEQQFIQRYEEILARFVKESFSTSNLSNIASNIGAFVQRFFDLTILWVGARAVMDGNLTVGELIAFKMLSGQVSGPVLRLVNLWQSFQQTMVSVDRLGDIMNEPAEPAFNPSRTTLPSIHGEVVLERVTFRYRTDGTEVLRRLSLHIKPGMRVGIVGRSGSGKSTLTKLLQRLYVPESGRVLIDGVDLFQVEPAWLRRQIGVVLQENFLFNGSVRDNIAIANSQASIEDIVRVARIAGAEEFIEKLPKGYDTFVGERGGMLSGGQRQRIAIARALLNDPKVLIFDEATSALDYESERIIMNNIDQIAAGRTMFMIAHRLSTVRRCDVIFVMDHGCIIEQGTHEELLGNQGYYFALYQQQAG